MKLSLGKVIKYYSDRGFGFIQSLHFSSDDNGVSKVFFHIKKVKHLGIEPKLIEFENKNLINEMPLYIWYIPEQTNKGIAIKECWSDYTLIPNEYLIDFVGEAAMFLMKSPFYEIHSIVKPYSKIPLSSHQARNTPVIPCKKYSIVPSGICIDDKIHPINTVSIQKNISLQELNEIKNYINIYKKHNFKEHYEVNEFISKMNLWGKFPKIRSLNDHGSYRVQGILPKFFAIICEELNIEGASGAPLDRATPY